MAKAIHRIWHNLDTVPKWQRTIIKTVIYAIVLLLVLFPNPSLLLEQIEAYLNTEALFDTDFPEMQKINERINALLPKDYTFQDEYKTIVKFVYDNIHYKFDWDNWLNSEYWPSASETWRRGFEDCDGQAILAVAIFRSRGYRNATIVGSMQHLWIRVNGLELMGPDTEKFVDIEEGKKQFHVPSWKYMLLATASQIHYFPKFRIALLLVILLLLAYHPGTAMKKLVILILSLMLGFALIVDWAHEVVFYNHLVLDLGLFIGCLLILIAYILAFLTRPARRQ